MIIDIPITLHSRIVETDCRTFMTWILHQMDIKPQQVSHQESKEYGTVFTVVFGIVKILLYKIRLLISMLFTIRGIIESMLNKMQQFSCSINF